MTSDWSGFLNLFGLDFLGPFGLEIGFFGLDWGFLVWGLFGVFEVGFVASFEVFKDFFFLVLSGLVFEGF